MFCGIVNLPESALLGGLPLLVLLFVLKPTATASVDPARTSCPRCAKSHSGGQHFCTGCGWDLNAFYSPEDPDGVQASTSQPQVQASMPSTAVAEPPESADVPAPDQSNEIAREALKEVAGEVALEQEPALAAESTSGTENGESSPSDPESPAEAPSPTTVAEPEVEHVPWGTYDPGVAPTAAVMTSRGIERFDEGKYQEAIDQFTKALALDSDYADALKRRAEAYAQLGRVEQAAEDRRHHQRLDPSSSPG